MSTTTHTRMKRFKPHPLVKNPVAKQRSRPQLPHPKRATRRHSLEGRNVKRVRLMPPNVLASVTAQKLAGGSTPLHRAPASQQSGITGHAWTTKLEGGRNVLHFKRKPDSVDSDSPPTTPADDSKADDGPTIWWSHSPEDEARRAGSDPQVGASPALDGGKRLAFPEHLWCIDAGTQPATPQQLFKTGEEDLIGQMYDSLMSLDCMDCGGGGADAGLDTSIDFGAMASCMDCGDGASVELEPTAVSDKTPDKANPLDSAELSMLSLLIC